MGLVESLLGIRFRIKQPAATYRACICGLPIGGADIVRVRASNYEVLRFETSSRNSFSIDNENSTRRLIIKENARTFSELAKSRFCVAILVFAQCDSRKIPARNRLTLLKKLCTGTRKRAFKTSSRVIFWQNAHWFAQSDSRTARRLRMRSGRQRRPQRSFNESNRL